MDCFPWGPSGGGGGGGWWVWSPGIVSMPAVPCAWGPSWGESGGVTGGCGLQACGLFSMGAIGGWGVVAGGCGLQALCPCQQYHAPGGHHGVRQGV